jgi:CheY-like chemotaxis protein
MRRFIEPHERIRIRSIGAARVLIVHDDLDDAELVRDALEAGGYTAEIAASLDDARRRMRDGTSVDLIIIDAQLPSESGTNLLLTEAPEGRPPPVLMMSAIDRPFTFGHLHASVIRTLATWRLRLAARPSQ